MKKLIYGILILSILLCCVSCHKHAYSQQWSFDKDSHWHSAVCGHDLVIDKAEHNWNNGIELIAPTHTSNGIIQYECTVCGQTKTEQIPLLADAHTFSSEWSYDEKAHWHASTCAHDVTIGNGSHTFVKGICSVCGYIVFEGTWKFDIKETASELTDLYLSYDYSQEELEKNYDMFRGMALVEIMEELDGLNSDSFVMSFSNDIFVWNEYYFNERGSCTSPYFISDLNELYIQPTGVFSDRVYANVSYERLGIFNEDYTKLVCTGEMDLDGLTLSKNPEPYYLVWSALYERKPSVDKIKALIGAGADVNDGRGEDGESALMYAIYNGYYDIALCLIEAGADVNVRDEDGLTALIYVLDYDEPEYVHALIDAGADVNVCDEDGVTALMYAIDDGYYDIALYLIECGADVNVRDEDGYSALDYAFDRYIVNADVIKALSSVGAKEGLSGASVLECAIVYDELEIALDLIENGADVNAIDESGHTPLMYAVVCDYPVIVAALIYAGADVNAKDEDGSTALIYGLIYNNDYNISIDTIRVLIENGADISYGTIDGMSPKDFASMYCSADVAALFSE